MPSKRVTNVTTTFLSGNTKTFDDFDLERLCEQEDLDGLTRGRSAILREGAISTEGWTLLMHCCKASERVMRHLVSLGEDPLAIGHPGETVMHMTARCGNLGASKYFLGLGVPIGTVSLKHVTPLMAACGARRHGAGDDELDAIRATDNTPAIAFLLSRGADPNAPAPGLSGPLDILCQGRDWEPDGIRCLVDAGARIHQRLKNGSSVLATSLLYAMNHRKPNTQVVRALLDAGATFDPESGQFESAIELAIAQNNGPALEHLHEHHGDVVYHTGHSADSGRHWLREAFARDSHAAAAVLLDMGADPSNIDADERKRGPRCAHVLTSFLARKAALEALGQGAPPHERSARPLVR